MSDVVPFPGAMPASEVLTERAEDGVHARAFRDLESKICDLDRWAELAASLAAHCCCDKRTWRELEQAVLVVQRLSVEARDFKHDYYRAWKDAPEHYS
jgi:hypothetical protein